MLGEHERWYFDENDRVVTDQRLVVADSIEEAAAALRALGWITETQRLRWPEIEAEGSATARVRRATHVLRELDQG